ncbi:MAG: ankyrin repeat domain-containing protein [Gemmatimonadetes bacterium]|jgi:ankyrin repeat protein|nr:ankyrin repeat domain-containing protein [Gemmatimonadota bacterium]
MDEVFGPAAVAIANDDLGDLADLLRDDPSLATKRSSCGHPTLLQLVACEERNIRNPARVANLLVDAGAPTEEPLIAAAGCESWEVLRTLVERGVPVDRVDGWSALDESLYWDNKEIAGFLIEHGARPRSLRAAAALGSIDELESFFVDGALTEGAGPVRSPFADTVPIDTASDAQHIIDNAFVSAVNSDQRSTAELLLERGARVNATPPGFHWRGTALHAAAWRGSRPLVEWLLSVGANPAIRDGMVNSDAVGWAKHHGHEDLVGILRVGH